MSPATHRPWPVVLLTAAGAWLAAIPLLIALGALLGDTLTRGAAPYIVGVLVLAGAVTVLRSRDLPLFLEQLAIPALLVGGGMLGLGVTHDMQQVGGALVLLVAVLVVAAALPQAWLRILLGALAAGLLGVALVPESHWSRLEHSVLWVLHGLLAVWLLATYAPLRSDRMQTLVAPLAQGWLLATLLALAWMSGTSFLVAGVTGGSALDPVVNELTHQGQNSWVSRGLQGLSLALVLAAAAWGAHAWPVLKTPLAIAVALIVAGLAWFMPALGAVLLALVVTALMHRWLLCSTCALAAAWIVGAFYYQLNWPLADKALLLVTAGALLGALVWVAHLRGASNGNDNGRDTGSCAQDNLHLASVVTPTPNPWLDARTWALLGSAALCLLVANGAIWQKENLIAHGKPMYLPLVPVDPRSLMQGDYMRLRFAALADNTLPLLSDLGGKRPHMVVTLDARNVASIVRVHRTDTPLAPGEMLVELTPKDGNWVVVTDAWFFKEGDAALWQSAKFGEFRVLPDGRALLVGLADADVKGIATPTPQP